MKSRAMVRTVGVIAFNMDVEERNGIESEEEGKDCKERRHHMHEKAEFYIGRRIDAYFLTKTSETFQLHPRNAVE